jgi:prepilin peptidase CpaA
LSVLLAIPAAGLLAYAALHDLAVRTVPNWLPAVLLMVGALARLLDHSLIMGLCVAAVAFVLLFGIWAVGAMGGGDVKLWAATVLLVPPVWQEQLGVLVHVVMAGGLLALLYMALSLVVKRPQGPRPRGYLSRLWRAERWRIRRRGPLPYACAIAAGTVVAFLPEALSNLG